MNDVTNDSESVNRSVHDGIAGGGSIPSGKLQLADCQWQLASPFVREVTRKSRRLGGYFVPTVLGRTIRMHGPVLGLAGIVMKPLSLRRYHAKVPVKRAKIRPAPAARLPL